MHNCIATYVNLLHRCDLKFDLKGVGIDHSYKIKETKSKQCSIVSHVNRVV